MNLEDFQKMTVEEIYPKGINEDYKSFVRGVKEFIQDGDYNLAIELCDDMQAEYRVLSKKIADHFGVNILDEGLDLMENPLWKLKRSLDQRIHSEIWLLRQLAIKGKMTL